MYFLDFYDLFKINYDKIKIGSIREFPGIFPQLSYINYKKNKKDISILTKRNKNDKYFVKFSFKNSQKKIKYSERKSRFE